MKINLAKKEYQVVDTLNAIQKGCTARTLEIEYIKAEMKVVSVQLKSLMGHENNWRGVKVTITSNFGKKPASYNGIPDATFIVIERGPSCWFVTSCTRKMARCTVGGHVGIEFTDANKRQIIDYTVKYHTI